MPSIVEYIKNSWKEHRNNSDKKNFSKLEKSTCEMDNIHIYNNIIFLYKINIKFIILIYFIYICININ